MTTDTAAVAVAAAAAAAAATAATAPAAAAIADAATDANWPQSKKKVWVILACVKQLLLALLPPLLLPLPLRPVLV